jgi:hypothetical protein
MESLESDLEFIEDQLGDARRCVGELEKVLAGCDQREKAAKELLKLSQRQSDQLKARQPLEEVAQLRGMYTQRLEGARRRLADWEARKQKFPMARLTEERRVDQLRRGLNHAAV